MSEVTRYNFELYHCNGGEMEVSPEGDFVDYDDYAAIKAERDALLAENLGLNEMYRGVVKELDDTCFEMGMMAGEKSMEYPAPETPATDAALNAVRAEGVDICISSADTCMSAGEYWPPLGSMREIARSLRAGTDTTSSQYESLAGGK